MTIQLNEETVGKPGIYRADPIDLPLASNWRNWSSVSNAK